MRNHKGQFIKGTTNLPHRDHWDREWLHQEYVVNQRSGTDIAEQQGVSSTVIYHHLRKNGIHRRASKAVEIFDVDGVSLATCSRCGSDKPVSEFSKSKDCKHGITGWCKECRAAYLKGYDRGLRTYRKRPHGWEDTEKTRKDAYAKRVANARHRAKATKMRVAMLQRARRAGVPVDERLSVDFLIAWLIAQTRCECCGREMQIHDSGAKGHRADSITLDRIIPAAGYVLGNVSLLCWRCNSLKRDATPEELANVSRWLLQRTGK